MDLIIFEINIISMLRADTLMSLMDFFKLSRKVSSSLLPQTQIFPTSPVKTTFFKIMICHSGPFIILDVKLKSRLLLLPTLSCVYCNCIHSNSGSWQCQIPAIISQAPHCTKAISEGLFLYCDISTGSHIQTQAPAGKHRHLPTVTGQGLVSR